MNITARAGLHSAAIDAAEEIIEHPLKRRYDKALALFSKEDFRAAAGLMEGFSNELAGASTAEVFGSPVADPTASIIVVSYRHGPNVECALNEIARQIGARAFEVILVDTGNRELFPAAQNIFKSFVAVTPPFPAGCSGGRNVGAHFARAPFLIFLDDDGIMQPGCIGALIACLEETGAVAVRGRVRPLTSPKLTAPHYDLGERRLPSLITCEGVSIWTRSEFESAGGFDPILAGHEGIDLCGKLWRFHGPAAFVYEPNAVLLHDFAADESAAMAKKERYDRNRAYIELLAPALHLIHSTTSRASSSGRTLYLSARALELSPSLDADAVPVSVITTARNGVRWLEEYSRAWRAQSQKDFQLVFVDDGSQDGTADVLRDLWEGDDRLTLVERPFSGRGASLNAAMAQAKHDICLVADVDDLSVPLRIAWTVKFFRENPDCDYVSFLAFTETDHYRIGRPHTPFIDDMDVRALFGMPGSFPTFGFRKSHFPLPFDEELRGGADCKWLHRNMEVDNGIKGRLVHIPVVYYRQHEGQITRHFNESQKAVRKELIYFGFARVLGPLSERDRRFVDILVDIRKANAVDKKQIADWLSNLLMLNEGRRVYNPKNLGWALLQAFDQIETAGGSSAATSNVNARIMACREQAEIHIANRDFKEARRALRKALTLRDDAEIRSRLLAANRFVLIRMLSRSTPYVRN